MTGTNSSAVASHRRTPLDAGSVRVRTAGTWRNYRIADTVVVNALGPIRAIQEGS